MSVIDASVVAHLLLDLPLARAAEEHVLSAREPAQAPDLLNVEVLHVLRRHEQRGLITEARSREALDDLLILPIAHYPTSALVDAAWSLRRNFTAYDAMYLALAEALGTSLVTADGPLAAAARARSAVKVVLLA